jgi:hypothetical protein
MANLIKDKFETTVAATITLTSIANNAGRISAQIDNTTLRAPLMIVYWRIKNGGTAPTAGAPYTLYLIRADADGVHEDEGLSTADAAQATKPNNAEVIDAIPAIATLSVFQYGSCWVQNPGPKFSFLVFNEAGQTISATSTDHYVRYVLVTPEVQ